MATILEGLNQIAEAVGGTGEAESNLEALNQISEALGGSADATENAAAIANIAENASGGGGSSDFSTAEVTVRKSAEVLNQITVEISAPILAYEDTTQGNFTFDSSISEQSNVSVVIPPVNYGYAIMKILTDGYLFENATGDIEVDGVDGLKATVYGDGTITITTN